MAVYFYLFKIYLTVAKTTHTHYIYILGKFLTLIFPRQRIKEGYFRLIFVWRSLKDRKNVSIDEVIKSKHIT
jgi:hypothetical protein